MERRFWVALVLCLPLVVLAMSDGMAPGQPLATAAVRSRSRAGSSSSSPRRSSSGAAARSSCAAWSRCADAALNMFTLIALGTGAAYAYQRGGGAPARRPSPPRSAANAGDVPIYFEAAAVIVTLILLGQVLELRARSRTGAAIRALLGLAPKTARRLRDDGSEEDVPLDAVSRAIACACDPARRFRSTASCSKGEARSTSRWSPASRSPWRRTPATGWSAATVNGTGSLVMRAERVGAETLLAQIVRMVAEAQRSRAPIQRLADVVSG